MSEIFPVAFLKYLPKIYQAEEVLQSKPIVLSNVCVCVWSLIQFDTGRAKGRVNEKIKVPFYKAGAGRAPSSRSRLV